MERPLTRNNVGRTVLNIRESENNIINKLEFGATIIPIFEDIIRELLDHCGPNANYALLLDPADMTSDSIFTCDGINTIRAINYINSVSEATRKLIQHIGGKIDRAAFDGTTSSMIIALKAIIYMMESPIIDETPYTSLIYKYNEFIGFVEKYLEEETWTIDKVLEAYGWGEDRRDDVIWQIAYSQAYTSSHGDHELATVVAKAFVMNQQNDFGTIGIDRYLMEKPNPWYVVTSEAQFETMDAVVIDSRMNNKELQTALEHENCTLMVHHEEINDNDKSAMAIFDAFKYIAEVEDEYLVVIVAGMSGGFRASVIDYLTATKLFKKIAVCVKSIPFNPEEVNELLVLRNLVTTTPASMKEIETIRNVHYKCYDSKVSVDNIFERTEDGKHPNYGDETKIEFMATIVQLERIMERLREDTTPAKLAKLNDVYKVYNRLIYPITTSIMVGGTSHENISMLDTMVDVVGATRSALVKGFTVGSYGALKRAIIKSQAADNDVVQNAIACAICDGIVTIEYHLGISNETRSNTSVDLITGNVTTIGDTEINNTNQSTIPWIIQPSTVHTALLMRFREVCLKLAKTSSIIVRGGLNVKNKEDLIGV